MKHVLFYTDTPNVGGAEKHMLLLAKHLEKMGVSVSLAYGKYSQISKMHGEFKKVCKNVFVLNTTHKHDPRHFFELMRLLNKHSFDLAHLHLWNPGSCRYGFYSLSKKGIPIVTTEHDPFELKGFKKLIKKTCLAKTERTITVSVDNYGLLEEYYKFPKNRLEIVHNGIDLYSFLDNLDKVKLPVQHGAHVLTCIAELHERKGHRHLFAAFKKLQAEIPSAELVLVGTGPDEAILKKMAMGIPNIHFLGWRRDIPAILQASDLFILPSLKEAFGQVIVEAMASGVVVIATNNGGPKDIIDDGINGYLVPPANSEAILEKLLVLLKNPGQKKEMEKEARNTVITKYSAKKMTEKTLEVYEKIC